MRKLTQSKRMMLVGVLSFAVALLMTLGVRSYLQQKAAETQIRTIGAGMQRSGEVSQNEYIRVRTLRSSMLAGQNLSDEDFDWCLSILSQTRPHSVVNSNKNAMMIGILLRLPENNDVTPERKERLYTAVAPLLRSKEQLDRAYALNLLGALKERRAIPDILPLLNDPKPGLRTLAREALDKMGYHVGKAKTP